MLCECRTHNRCYHCRFTDMKVESQKGYLPASFSNSQEKMKPGLNPARLSLSSARAPSSLPPVRREWQHGGGQTVSHRHRLHCTATLQPFQAPSPSSSYTLAPSFLIHAVSSWNALSLRFCLSTSLTYFAGPDQMPPLLKALHQFSTMSFPSLPSGA